MGQRRSLVGDVVSPALDPYLSLFAGSLLLTLAQVVRLATVLRGGAQAPSVSSTDSAVRN
jgi:hypothetical protein